MAAKKRRNSIYVVHEGYWEGYFLEHLAGYSNVRLNTVPCNGGSANEIVYKGTSLSARDVNVYVLFDEDFELKPGYTISDEALEGLENAWKIETTLKGRAYRDLQNLNKAMRNPIIIVSYPKSIEGFLLRLLGIPLQDLEGKTTQHLKNTIKSFLGNVILTNDDNVKILGNKGKIAKYKQEITMLRQSEPQNMKQRQYLEAKTKEFERNINKVKFMRFLNDELPLSKLAAKSVDIKELDILLKAFGLPTRPDNQ